MLQTKWSAFEDAQCAWSLRGDLVLSQLFWQLFYCNHKNLMVKCADKLIRVAIYLHALQETTLLAFITFLIFSNCYAVS